MKPKQVFWVKGSALIPDDASLDHCYLLSDNEDNRKYSNFNWYLEGMQADRLDPTLRQKVPYAHLMMPDHNILTLKKEGTYRVEIFAPVPGQGTE